MSEIELRSQANADYTKLCNLLAAGNWQEADRETCEVMVKVGGDPNEWYDCLLDRHIKNFPRIDLRTINRLWVYYSDGRFGFSVQLKICQEVGFNTFACIKA